MSTFQFDCAECGEPSEADVNSPRGRDELCYKHYVKGIRFAFRGVQGGRESFHDDTMRSVQNEIVSSAAAQGREVRPKTKVGGTAFTAPSKA